MDFLPNALLQNLTSATSGRYDTDSALTEAEMNGKIVIAKSLRRKILHCLHSVHQGVDSMKAHTNNTGMNTSIHNFRVNYSICATIAPSQSWEPFTMTPSPEWPFQQKVMDIFHVGHVAYLACADRLNVWFILYHLKPGHANTSKLMSICWQLFQKNSVLTVAHLSPQAHSNSFRHGVWSTDYPQLHTPNPITEQSIQ